MKLMQIPLKTIIPLIVFVVMFPFVLLVLYFSYVDNIAALAVKAEQQLRQRLSYISLDIERDLRSRDVDHVRRSLAVSGADASLLYLVIADKNGKILFSTRQAWVGRTMAESIDQFEAKAMQTSLVGERVFIHQAQSLSIDGYFPVLLGSENLDSIRSYNHGVLHGKYTYWHDMQEAKQDFHEKLLQFCVGLFVLMFLLLSVLRYWLNRPLNQLIHYIALLEAGQLDASLNMYAGPELSSLGHSLSNMSLKALLNSKWVRC